MVQFARHDTKLFSDDRNRFTPNCIALYKWMRKIDKDMFVEFERKVETQGHTAHVAILDFREAVIAWLDPEVWTMTGLIIVGMTRKRFDATAARIEDLVILAVRSLGRRRGRLRRELEARKAAARREIYGPDDTP